MKILVWRGKYGDTYYDASTNEALEASAQSILKDLVNDGWIPEPEEFTVSPEDQEYLAMKAETLKKLPEKLRKEITARLQRVSERKRAYGVEQRLVALTRRVAAEGAFWEPIADSSESAKNFDEWVARSPERYRYTGDQKERKITAWSVLQNRSGVEYEDYELCDVITSH